MLYCIWLESCLEMEDPGFSAKNKWAWSHKEEGLLWSEAVGVAGMGVDPTTLAQAQDRARLGENNYTDRGGKRI